MIRLCRQFQCCGILRASIYIKYRYYICRQYSTRIPATLVVKLLVVKSSIAIGIPWHLRNHHPAFRALCLFVPLQVLKVSCNLRQNIACRSISTPSVGNKQHSCKGLNLETKPWNVTMILAWPCCSWSCLKRPTCFSKPRVCWVRLKCIGCKERRTSLLPAFG